MDDKPSNPQVFPITQEVDIAGRRTTHTSAGLTLGDYFAGLALAGMLANPTYNGNEAVAATAAYEYAAAMLKAREGT